MTVSDDQTQGALREEITQAIHDADIGSYRTSKSDAVYLAHVVMPIVERLTAERDRAREIAGRLEKELADKTAAVLALHKTWYEVNGKRYEERCFIIDDLPEDHVCITDRSAYGEVCDPENGEHYALGCIECRQATEDGAEARELWPCPTAALFLPPSSVDEFEALGGVLGAGDD